MYVCVCMYVFIFMCVRMCVFVCVPLPFECGVLCAPAIFLAALQSMQRFLHCKTSARALISFATATLEGQQQQQQDELEQSKSFHCLIANVFARTENNFHNLIFPHKVYSSSEGAVYDCVCVCVRARVMFTLCRYRKT